MPDAATVVIGTAFVGSLGAMLTYIANTVISDRNRYTAELEAERARTQRAEEQAELWRERVDREISNRQAALNKLGLCELRLERMSIEYGHSDTQQPRHPRALP